VNSQQRRAVIGGILAGILISAAFVWWLGGPSEATVKRTVVTTIQEESPRSILVTGTLGLRTTIDIDSTSAVTPSWVTTMLQVTQPELLPFTMGTASVRLRIPGSVSYGFDVQTLKPEMITIEDGVVSVSIPDLAVQSVEPDLSQLEVETSSRGWMKMFTGDMQDQVRRDALSRVEATLRRQAEARLASSTQPRINTARALQAMLKPALQSAGIEDPEFRFRIGGDLVLSPSGPPETLPTGRDTL